jgi:oligoendopeptidase F
LAQLQTIQENISKNINDLEEKSEEIIDASENNAFKSPNSSPLKKELEQAFQEQETSIAEDKQEQLIGE